MGADPPCSYCPLSLSSSLLLSLQFLSRAIALSYHCSIEPDCHSTSINLLLITPFILLLNSSTSSLPSYSLLLAALLNSYTNSSIVLPPCSNLLNSATFTDSLSPPPNTFLISAKNSSTISYSNSHPSRSSNTFPFHMSATLSYTYDNIHWICSSTSASLILIYMYSLHTVINPATLLKLPSNSCGLATLTCMLGCESVAVPSAPSKLTCAIITWSTASCSCCCQTTCSKSILC